MLSAPIEDALDGNTNKRETQRRRRQVADSGERFGAVAFDIGHRGMGAISRASRGFRRR